MGPWSLGPVFTPRHPAAHVELATFERTRSAAGPRSVACEVLFHRRREAIAKRWRALDAAVAQRQPQSVVHHSDHAHAIHLDSLRAAMSPGRRPALDGILGDPYDNALCESFFASLECELIDRRTFKSHTEGRMAVFQYI